jgi:dephospho-CoA kinase
MLDTIVVVDCSPTTQHERVLARNGMDPAQTQRIMDAQASRAQRLEHADDIIENAAQPEAILAQVATLHRRYLELNAERSRSSGLSSRPAYRTICPPGGSDS